MPGWYTHLDLARKIIDGGAFLNHPIGGLTNNVGAQPLFQASRVAPADLVQLAKEHPAYFALGAIGPDIFFFLPDFKPPAGNLIFPMAVFIRDHYMDLDEHVFGPYEDSILPAVRGAADLLSVLTGGLAQQIATIFNEGFRIITDALVVAASRQYDFFGLMGSGVPRGYDEQSFFWSDMLHYRKTFEFAAHLWQNAGSTVAEKHDLRRRQQQAFALGWMTHLAVDVTGHSFVNQKAGGPFRLHWQRHHLVENHIDALIYSSEYGADSIYQMLPSAALHLWIGFDEDGGSLLSPDDKNSIFHRNPGFQYLIQKAPPDDSIPGAAYDTGDDTPAVMSRRRAWDFDPLIPGHLARFMAESLAAVYSSEGTGSDDPNGMGQWKSHPTILEELGLQTNGYPDALPIDSDPDPATHHDTITTTYWWLFEYLKHVTTDYWKICRPEAPEIDDFPDAPSPQGAGVHDPSFKGGAPSGPPPSLFELLLHILGEIFEQGAKNVWNDAKIIAGITGRGTYSVREWLYDHIELPLYNAWFLLRSYFVDSGFVVPMQGEISPGLTTLGLGVDSNMPQLAKELEDLSGGLLSQLGVPPIIGLIKDEPSGSDRDETCPHDVVVDPPILIESAINNALQQVVAIQPACGSAPGGETPSEFLRPWSWPSKDNAGDDIPSEFPLVVAGHYTSGDDATVLLTPDPGDPNARTLFEQSLNADTTTVLAKDLLPKGHHLGDPIDYGAYVIALLTSGRAGIANFNLDSDRGYAFLCWDWERVHGSAGEAAAGQRRSYQAPLRPGAGWCSSDLPSPLGSNGPAMHDPRSSHPEDVKVRYLDKQVK